MGPLADLNKYYWKYKHLFIPGLLCAIVSAGFSVAAPIARAITKQTERIAYKNKMPSAPSFPKDAQVAGQKA